MCQSGPTAALPKLDTNPNINCGATEKCYGPAPITPAGPANTNPQSAGQAQTGTNVTLMNPLQGVDCSSGNGNCLSAFLANILQFIVKIGTVIVILMLVYVGFLFVVAQGNDSKITEAKNALLWTVVGALILLGAQAIALGIQATVTALGG